MTRIETRFDLHTVELVCICEDLPAALAREADLDWVIGERRSAGPRGLPQARLTVGPAPPSGLPLPPVMIEQAIARPGRLRIGRSAGGDRVLLVNEAIAVTLLAGGDSLIEAAPSDRYPGPALAEAMIHALDHAVSSHGQCLAHAACLITPDGRGAVILHAASGTGKTTTAMALALAGFGLSGDDTTALVAPSGAEPVAGWGLPRGARVDRRTVELLPALRNLVDGSAWDANGEQMIGRPALRRAGLVTAAGPLPVVAVVSLSRSAEAGAGVERWSRIDAMEALMQDNISAHPDGFFPGQEQRFDIFAALVGSALCLRVPVRGEPQQVAAGIAAALGC